MTIKNRWKSVLERKGVTQAQIAEMTGLSKPFISGVVNGQSVLSESALETVCERIGVDMEQIYPDSVLRGIYGSDRERKARKEVVSVKLHGETAKLLAQLKEAHGAKTNADMVSEALKRLREVDATYGRTL